MSITLVQKKINFNASAGTGTATFVSNVTINNTIVVFAAASQGDNATSVTDSQGNTYTSRAISAFDGSHVGMVCYTAPVTSAGSCTVTVHWGSSVSSIVEVREYHSSIGTLTFDSSATASDSGAGTGSGISVGGLSLPSFAQTTELVCVGLAFQTAGVTLTDPSSPWTDYDDSNSGINVIGLATADDVAAISSTTVPSWTISFTSLTTYYWASIYITLYESAVSSIFEDEQPYNPVTQPRVWQATPIQYDETSTNLANFAHEQEEPWVARTQTISWLAKLFLDEEPFRRATLWLEQEEPWIPSSESLLWLSRPYLDDEICPMFLVMTGSQSGNYRVQNNIEGYNIWVGSGVLPNLTQAPTAFSLTLPINHTLALPGSGTLTYYVLVTKQDLYGLNSQNQYYTTITIDSAGNLVLPPVSPPQDFSLVARPDSTIRVKAAYPGYGKDAYPADQWRVWIGVTPPNTSIDIPTLITSVTGSVLFFDLTGYTPGTYYGAVTLLRMTDSTESVPLTASVVMPTVPSEITPVPGGYEILP